MFKRISLSKRVMLVLSLVGVLAISAIPALSEPVFFVGDGVNDGSFFPDDGFFVSNPFDDQSAPVSQEFSQRRITSGAASPSVDISNSGNNANICAPVQQTVNTGNVANQQGVVQYRSEAGDISFEGSSITIEPSLTSDCTQTINQAVGV